MAIGGTRRSGAGAVIYRFGDFELDPGAGELRRAGRAVPLQPKPLALLCALVEARDRIVPKEELLERLWPGETVTPSSLARAVSVARSAIDDRGETRCIRSHPRRGYRFHDRVVEIGGAAPATSEPGLEGDHALPFTGRGDAAARLDAAWQRSAAGRGGVALIVGPPGIGKSRLLEHFAAETRRRGATVLQGRALEEEGEPAFWVWAQVLRGVLERAPECLHPRVVDSGALQALVPELGAPGADAAVARLPAEQRRFVFFDAVAATLRRVARDAPLLVAFEDVHWADPDSQRLLEHLAAELDADPVLIAATVRSELPPGERATAHTLAALRRHERIEEVSLASLSREDLEDLVERWAGRPVPHLAAALHTRTEGVPLFVREALRRLPPPRADRDWEREARELPATQVDWVADALARLPATSQRLLGAGATFGKHFAVVLAAEASDTDPAEALEALDPAIEAGVIEPDPENAHRYGFAHDLFRAAAYESLAPGARARLHHRAGELLERRHAEHPDAVIAELAYHCARALPIGDPRRAYDFATRAAERAYAARAYEQAVLHGEQALGALDHFDTLDTSRRLETLLALGGVARLAGDRERRRRHFDEALELARRAGSGPAFARAAIGLCDVSEWGVRDDAARAALEEALARLGAENPELEASLLARLGYLDAIARRTRAEGHLRRAVQLAREQAASDVLEEALYSLHLALGGPDDKDERAAILDEVRGAASAARDPVASVIVVLDTACDALELGEPERAAALRGEADETAGEPAHPVTRWHRAVYDTGIALLRGDLDEVVTGADAALRIGIRVQHPYAFGCWGSHRAHVAALRGDPGEVVTRFEPVLGNEDLPREWLSAQVARAHHARGEEDAARARLEGLLAPGIEAIPRNLRWFATLLEVAHAVADLEERAAASSLLEVLAPVEHGHGVMPMVICYNGPATFAMGRLYELLAQVDEAESCYAGAREAALAFGARPTVAQIELVHGRLLARRGRGSAGRALLESARDAAGAMGMAAVEGEAAALLGP